MEHSTRLSLRVTPGARRSLVVGRHGDAWKLRVAAAPERGRANAAVEELLAGVLGVPRAAVAIVGGHTTQDKVVAVAGIGRVDAERLLDAASASAGRAAPSGRVSRPGTAVARSSA